MDTRMSIEKISELSVPAMELSPLKRKSEKKHKSKEGKKRKRDHGDGDESKHHKLKKLRKSKPTEVSNSKSAKKSNTVVSTESPFHTQTASLYLPLAPISQRHPLEGICAEHLSPLILTYYPPLKGVILSYSEPRISERPFEDDEECVLVKCIDEYGAGYVWTTAEFLLFKPQRGGYLEGYVNLQNEGHLGLVCWNLFNASIERQRLPKDWKWIGIAEAQKTKTTVNDNYAEEGPGYFVDGDGNKVEGTIRFRVKEIESSHDRERGFLSIEGTMLGDEAEREVLEREYLSSRSKKDMRGRIGGAKALGATSLGVPMEHNPEETDGDGGLLKHRRQY
jgi:DNA-directed RNA polymerase I subunit RPA43